MNRPDANEYFRCTDVLQAVEWDIVYRSDYLSIFLLLLQIIDIFNLFAIP